MSQDRDTEKKDFTAVVPLVFALDLLPKELLDVFHSFPTSRYYLLMLDLSVKSNIRGAFQ